MTRLVILLSLWISTLVCCGQTRLWLNGADTTKKDTVWFLFDISERFVNRAYAINGETIHFNMDVEQFLCHMEMQQILIDGDYLNKKRLHIMWPYEYGECECDKSFFKAIMEDGVISEQIENGSIISASFVKYNKAIHSLIHIRNNSDTTLVLYKFKY